MFAGSNPAALTNFSRTGGQTGKGAGLRNRRLRVRIPLCVPIPFLGTNANRSSKQSFELLLAGSSPVVPSNIDLAFVEQNSAQLGSGHLSSHASNAGRGASMQMAPHIFAGIAKRSRLRSAKPISPVRIRMPAPISRVSRGSLGSRGSPELLDFLDFPDFQDFYVVRSSIGRALHCE